MPPNWKQDRFVTKILMEVEDAEPELIMATESTGMFMPFMVGDLWQGLKYEFEIVKRVWIQTELHCYAEPLREL